jgi:hypothetical protein
MRRRSAFSRANSVLSINAKTTKYTGQECKLGQAGRERAQAGTRLYSFHSTLTLPEGEGQTRIELDGTLSGRPSRQP